MLCFYDYQVTICQWEKQNICIWPNTKNHYSVRLCYLWCLLIVQGHRHWPDSILNNTTHVWQRWIFICRSVCQVNNVCWLFRAKDIDLIPYLTTRLVDDFASHIRLYRRSLAKVIEHRKDGKRRLSHHTNSHLLVAWFSCYESQGSLGFVVRYCLMHWVL